MSFVRAAKFFVNKSYKNQFFGSEFKNSYRARFTYPKGRRHQIVIASAKNDGWINAVAVAKEIDNDIKARSFDFSYKKYLPQEAQQIEMAPRNWDLVAICNQYKDTNKFTNELTTQKASWKQTDSCLNKVSKKALQLNQTDLLLSELLAIYSVGTLERVFANLKAACYFALKQGQIDSNPFVGFKLPKRPKQKIVCYESSEIKIILEAFRSDEYMSKYGRIPLRSPVIGQILYYFDTTPGFLRLMYKRHVYQDESKLTPEFIAQKHQITSKKGARYAPAAFVTGATDPITNREEFLQLLDSLSIPILVILAENAPPKSKAEMLAMAELKKLQTVRLEGTLGIYEEYPEAVGEAIQNFLSH